MTLHEHLANLERINQLTAHKATVPEVQQHLQNAADLIADAKNESVSPLGRFNAAYNASHALLTAALKMRGYRTSGGKGHRQLLFEMLDQLVPAAASAKSVLAQAHVLRNKTEYDGDPINVTSGLVSAMSAAAGTLDKEVGLGFKAFSKAQIPAALAAAVRRGAGRGSP